jgi:hypothetical protein
VQGQIPGDVSISYGMEKIARKLPEARRKALNRFSLMSLKNKPELLTRDLDF